MTNEIITKLQEALAPVAQKIGEGAEYGWVVVVKQQFAIGVVDTLTGVALLVLSVCSILLMCKGYKLPRSNREYSRGEFTGESIGLILCGGMGLLFFGMCAFSLLQSGIMHMVSPEFYALEFFINLVK